MSVCNSHPYLPHQCFIPGDSGGRGREGDETLEGDGAESEDYLLKFSFSKAGSSLSKVNDDALKSGITIKNEAGLKRVLIRQEGAFHGIRRM